MTVETCIKPAELNVLIVIHVLIDFLQQFRMYSINIVLNML